jgi:hypothetical protein
MDNTIHLGPPIDGGKDEIRVKIEVLDIDFTSEDCRVINKEIIMKKECENCIHWEPKIKDSRFGICQKAKQTNILLSPKSMISESQIVTGYEFGCNLFSTKATKQNHHNG